MTNCANETNNIITNQNVFFKIFFGHIKLNKWEGGAFSSLADTNVKHISFLLSDIGQFLI